MAGRDPPIPHPPIPHPPISHPRRIILSRRARFLATALVGIGCTPEPARGPTTRDAPPDAGAESLLIPSISGDDAGMLIAKEDEDAGPKVVDRDHDGIPDELDACPDVAGPASSDPKKNGCPTVVVRVCLSIVIPPKITFGSGGSNMDASSKSSFDMVEKTLKEHPEVLLVEIEGNTDATENARLGQARADAVKRELVKRGIDAARLTTTNAGANKPIDTNATEAGRAKNRRIELRVIRTLP
jgi:OmpA-OmpF porin, OOP family